MAAGVYVFGLGILAGPTAHAQSRNFRIEIGSRADDADVGEILATLERRYAQSAEELNWSVARQRAREVEDALNRAAETAERRVRTDRDPRAAALLNEAARSASHFTWELERQDQDPAHTDEDFHDLVRDYNRAVRGLSGTTLLTYVRAELNRAARALADLTRAYARIGGLKWNDVQLLAWDIRDAAEHVYAVAADRLEHGDRGDGRALNALANLRAAANQLYEQVTQDDQDSRGTEDTYRRLLITYHRTDRSLEWSRFDRHMQADFERVGGLLAQLNDVYHVSTYERRETTDAPSRTRTIRRYSP
jgi:hypothetical protein